MNKEHKQLLLQDLCARVIYGVKVTTTNRAVELGILTGVSIKGKISVETKDADIVFECTEVKPYLRSMSSMTEEERIEFSKLLVKRYCEEDWEGHISTSYCIEIDNVYTDDEDGIKYPSTFLMDAIDWLNKHHFDYRGLIPLGLAIEVTEENNPYKD